MNSVDTIDMFPVLLQSEALIFYLSKSSRLHYDQFRQTACSYQFCDLGPFLCSFGSYNSICFSVWNVKYLSSCSFLLPFFPQHYFDTVYCYVYRVASSVVCPGGRSQCPQNQTCCPSTSGAYVCCPDPNVSILYSLFTGIFSILPNNWKLAMFVKGKEIG